MTAAAGLSSWIINIVIQMTAAAGLSNCLNHQHYNPDDGGCRALKLPESSTFYSGWRHLQGSPTGWSCLYRMWLCSVPDCRTVIGHIPAIYAVVVLSRPPFQESMVLDFLSWEFTTENPGLIYPQTFPSYDRKVSTTKLIFKFLFGQALSSGRIEVLKNSLFISSDETPSLLGRSLKLIWD